MLVAINVLAFIWQRTTGGLASNEGLLSHGALLGIAVTQYGQWWRVVTGGFLHGGEWHILLNMVALMQLGTAVEEEYGKTRFLLIYAISLVGSGLAVVYAAPFDITVGASGAIFGLFGAYIAFALRLGERGRGMIAQVLPIIVINLVFTFAVPNISKAGHVGGLIVGLLAGLALFMVPAVRAREVAYAYTGGPPGTDHVETIEQPPDAAPHEEAGAPPLEVRDPRE